MFNFAIGVTLLATVLVSAAAKHTRQHDFWLVAAPDSTRTRISNCKYHKKYEIFIIRKYSKVLVMVNRINTKMCKGRRITSTEHSDTIISLKSTEILKSYSKHAQLHMGY